MPAYDASLNINNTSLNWPLAGRPVLSWTPPAGADHQIVWWSNSPSWLGATNISGNLGGGASSYTDPSHAQIDGLENYYWVVAYNASSSLAGRNYGVMGCQNTQTAIGGHLELMSDGSGSVVNVPFLFTFNLNPGGDYRSHITSTCASWTIGSPGPPFSGPYAFLGVFIYCRADHTLGSIINGIINGTGSYGYEVQSGSGSGVATEAQGAPHPLPVHADLFYLSYEGEAPGQNWGGPPTSAIADGVNSFCELSYVSPPSSSSFDPARTGPGGGGVFPTSPQSPTPLLNANGNGSVQIGGMVQPVMATPLPCIPCCSTCAPICDCTQAQHEHDLTGGSPGPA